ncbi:MAG: sugar phosphate isomerase/epimerase family protein [Phycisphaerae bacterium]
MNLGYNTNGFADHETADALAILREIGYRSVALTLERRHLNPPQLCAVPDCLASLKPLLQASAWHVTIETGSRYILDPRRKHQPTLLSAKVDERRRRLAFLRAAIDVAAGLNAESVSLWSGARDDNATDHECFHRLVAGLTELLEYAHERDMRVSFEPEPGMLIDTMARFEDLFDAVGHERLGLTLDVGHVHCLGDGDVGDHIRRWRDRLWNVHIEDMLPGVHEHLRFGKGDMDFHPIFAALREIDYRGPLHVELPRQSHNAVAVAQDAFAYLAPFLC